MPPVEKEMKKNDNSYLIVGSAPYVIDWWNLHKRAVSRSLLKICPLNNAWCIVGLENIHCWFTSNDFYSKGTIIPTREQLLSMAGVWGLSLKRNSDRNPYHALKHHKLPELHNNLQNEDNPYHEPSQSKNRAITEMWDYWMSTAVCPYGNARGSSTTFLNACGALMRASSNTKKELRIYVIGSDFDYSSRSHFYDISPEYRGTQDPLRYGEKWLTDSLDYLDTASKKFNTKIYNLSDNPNSLLPFEKVSLSAVF